MSWNGTYKICNSAEFRQVFDMFDTNKDGALSADELKEVLAKMGKAVSHTDAYAIIASLDDNSKVWLWTWTPQWFATFWDLTCFFFFYLYKVNTRRREYPDLLHRLNINHIKIIRSEK